MLGNNYFTNYEKMREEGLIEAFNNKRFSKLENYIISCLGVACFQEWSNWTYYEKKRFVCQNILKYVDDEKIKNKAEKWLKRRG